MGIDIFVKNAGIYEFDTIKAITKESFTRISIQKS
jgi:hypothetical protein